MQAWPAVAQVGAAATSLDTGPGVAVCSSVQMSLDGMAETPAPVSAAAHCDIYSADNSRCWNSEEQVFV